MAKSQRNRELAAIHIGKKELGLSDDEYRDYLEAWTGKRSSGKMDQEERQDVLDNFRRMGFETSASQPRVQVQDDDREPVKKIKALWLELWRMGKVRNPSLASLNAWVARQTDVEHVNWLRTDSYNKTIEALKKWRDR